MTLISQEDQALVIYVIPRECSLNHKNLLMKKIVLINLNAYSSYYRILKMITCLC